MKTIYVGGPIDRADHNDANAWRKSLQAIAANMRDGLMLFDPFFSFTITGDQALDTEKMSLISRTNRTFLADADGALFYLPAGVPVFGTIREIEYASARGTPTVVVCQTDISKVVEAYDLVTVPDIGAGLSLLVNLIDNEPKIVDPIPDPYSLMHTHKHTIPTQEHAQPPSTGDRNRIIATMAAILSQPTNAHAFPDGKTRYMMVVDTMTYNRVSHKLDEQLACVIGGKYDDGYLYVELIEKK